MKQAFLIFLLFHFDCHFTAKKPSDSYWTSMKHNFPFKNVQAFVIDSMMQSTYKKLPRTHNVFLDSLANENPTYFYSWQERDTLTNEFTVVSKRFERGPAIFYLIFSKQDSLISATQIAGEGSEAGYKFETKSRIIAKDTFLHIGAITDVIHFGKKTKGDSIFSFLVITKDGKMIEHKYDQKLEINFEKGNDKL